MVDQRSAPRVRHGIFNPHLALPSDHTMIGTHLDLTDTKCHLQAHGFAKTRATKGWALREEHNDEFQR